MNVTAIGGRVNKLERRRKDASSPGSAAAKAGISTSLIYRVVKYLINLSFVDIELQEVPLIQLGG